MRARFPLSLGPIAGLDWALIGQSCDDHAADLSEAADSVRDVRQADFGLRSGDPDGPYRERHHMPVDGEDVFNGSPVFGWNSVAPLDMLGHRLTLWLAPVNVAEEATAGHKGFILLGPVGAVGPNP